MDDIRIGFAEAAGLNRVSVPPCFHALYFRKKDQTKIIEIAILVNPLDSCPVFCYFSFGVILK